MFLFCFCLVSKEKSDPTMAINVSVQNNGGFLPDIMVTHIARVRINRVRFPTLPVVS